MTDRPTPQQRFLLSDEQINDMLLGYIDVLTLADEHGLGDLCAFIAARLVEGSPIQKMIEASVAGGNETALERYDAAVSLVKQSFPASASSEGPLGFVRRIARKLKVMFKS